QPVLGDSTSLPEKKIKFLFNDSADNLWIVSSLNLSRYNPETEIFQTYRFENYAPGTVNVLFLAEISNHLIAYAVEGLFVLPLSEADHKQATVKPLQTYENGKLFQDFYQFMGAYNNVLVLAKNNTTEPSQIFLMRLVNQPEIALELDTVLQLNEQVNDVEYCNLNDLLYIGTTNGMVAFNTETGRFGPRNFAGQDIQQILYTSNHRLYCSLPS